MGIWDIFTPDAGQKRRQWLNQNLDTPINKALSYYMGAGNSLPQALGLLADSNPIAGLDRAGTQSQDIFAADKTPMERLISTSNMLSETAGAGLGLLGAPAASKIGADVLTDVATRVSKNAKKAGNNVVESLNQRGPMPTLGSNGGNMFDVPRQPFDMGRGSIDQVDDVLPLVPYEMRGQDIADRLADTPSALEVAGKEFGPAGSGFSCIVGAEKYTFAKPL